MSDVHLADEVNDIGLTPEEQKAWDAQTRDEPAGAAEVAPAEPDQPSPQEGAAKPAKAETRTEETDPDILELGPDGKPKNAGQWVRHGALHQERERRKAAERAIEEERQGRARDAQERARLDERVRLLSEVLTTPAVTEKPTEDDPRPDPDTDIFAYTRWLERRHDKIMARLDQTDTGVKEVREQTEAERAESSTMNRYVADARAFAAQNPDFIEAYRHLQRTRGAQLQRQGYAAEQIPAMLQAEERGLRDRALSLGKSPAEMLYDFAKDLGHRTAPPVDPAAQNGNGAAPAANGAAKPSAVAQVEAIQRGQAASKSLSSAGGSPGDHLTPEALSNMPEDEFNALYARLSEQQVRALAGG